MGSAYLKQGDVVIASWAAGVEVLISTKTMLSSYAKNLRNRFEEGYGDAKNLRGRHLRDRHAPKAHVSPMSTTVAACCSSEWQGRDTESCSERSIADEAPREPNTEVELVHDRTPEDLSAGAFFRRLVSKALTHMPVSDTQVRERQATATHLSMARGSAHTVELPVGGQQNCPVVTAFYP